MIPGVFCLHGPTARTAWRRSRAWLWPVLAGTGMSCVDDGLAPTKDGADRSASLAVRAELVGLARAVDYTVGLVVSYERAGGSLVPLGEPMSFPVTSGAGGASQRIPIDLNPCLSDPARAPDESGGCRLSVTLTLSDATGELDRLEQTLGVVREGDQVEPAEPFVLTPAYPLTIVGAGPGTGSGVVSVPLAGSQAALSCQITAGQAAGEGCTGRYPQHTELTLTATPTGEGTAFAGWGADCDAVPAGNLCTLTTDGPRTATAGFTLPATTGALEVQIAGLPAGVAAQVTVSNSRGFSAEVGGTVTLTALEPGADYVITARPVPVPAEEQPYSPDPEVQRATVEAGGLVTVQIGYNPPETGSLAVTILGLPSEVEAGITVSGPSFPEPEQVTAGALLSGLTPGPYTVLAGVVETADQIYAPTPPSQTSTVAPNETTHDSISYAPTRGSLTVTVSGLVSGTEALVTVAGPNGFSQQVSATTVPPLGKLVPGVYTVTAASVTSPTGQPYDPTVTPSQPVTIAPGGAATVAVSYSAPAAAKLVFVQQPTTTVSGAPIAPAVTVEVRDAQDRALRDYAQAISLALRGGPPGATLGGTVRVTPQAGVATFSDLTVNLEGSYVLVATSGSLAESISDAFAVVPAPVSSERSTVEVAPTALRTCCDTATVTVTARDAAGTPVVGATVVLETSGTVVLVQTQPAGPTDANGVATGRVIGRTIGSEPVAARINGVLVQQTATVNVTAGIAFADGDILAVRQEGGTPSNLTSGIPDRLSFPAWSPDGSRIAFTLERCEDFCRADIYVMDVDGTDTLNLTAAFDPNAIAPTWSPDGNRIAFEAEGAIYLTDVNGSTPRNLTPDLDLASAPDWSRDGSRIVFLLDECGEGCISTFAIMNANGSGRDTLSGEFTLADFLDSPKWSPDGTRIAFSSYTCGDERCNGDIMTVAPNGSDLVNLTERLDDNASQPAWSPGGGRIAFNRDTCNDGCSEINIMSARDGSGVTPLTEAEGAQPTWR